MNTLEKFREIQVLLFDVDGVFTDSTVLVTETGEHLRSFHMKDGFAVRTATRSGLRLIAISGGRSQGVRIRLERLGFEQVFLGVEDKLACYEELIEKEGLDEGSILYMGDDLPDYPVMRRVGFPVCPADAVREIVEIAQYVSSKPGGQGCVRDVLEKVLRIQGKWPVPSLASETPTHIP